jgi:hypothetical protein
MRYSVRSMAAFLFVGLSIGLAGGLEPQKNAANPQAR